MAVTTEAALETLDTTDVDRWIGRPLGGGQLKEPVTANDIRRWLQPMHNPNPIHYDDDAAAKRVFRKLDSLKEFEHDPEWTDEQITRIEDEKIAYYKTFRDHVRRTFAQVQDGEALPKGVLGPHSIATFTTEWRAYIMTVWGASRQDLTWPTSTMEAGWLPQMSRDEERAKIDPAMADGAYAGAS